jgi:glutathione synthase/RimK-type ligase-like ATP-grasp enzyme
MAQVVKRIGLSLGADICWPICFEEIVRKLDLKVPSKKDTVSFEVERVRIAPFDMREPRRYDVVLDRLTHWFMHRREWVKQQVVVNDTYVLNNPWSIQANEKHTTYAAMARLGVPVPTTWLLPQKDYEPKDDLKVTLSRYADLFDLGQVGAKIGYPLFMKPYDGGAWVGVTKIDDEKKLRASFEESGKRLMHLQKAVSPFDLFVRCIGVGPQTRCIKYDASAPLHARYTTEKGFLTKDEEQVLVDTTLTINTFFGWDFNSCEALRQNGVFLPIDFANACPDSQVTSLHEHFPWLVLAKVRWSLFVAATGRKMRKTLDWDPYFDVAAKDLPYAEKLKQYAAIARKRLDADRFQEFCDKNLGALPEIAHQFFGTDRAKDAVRQKVAALFPAHEVDQFTEHFWTAIQRWRQEEGRPR